MTTLRRCGAEIWDGGDGIWARPGPPCAMPDLAWPSGDWEGEGEGKEGGTRQGLRENGPFPPLNRATLPLHAFISPVLLPCVSRSFFSRTNCALCIEADPLASEVKHLKKQLRPSSQPDPDVFPRRCRHDHCLSDDGVLPGDAKAISSFLRNLVTGFASIGLDIALDKTEVIPACPDFPGCTWTATRNFILLGAAIRYRQWCESLLCKRVAKASALIRAIGRCRDAHGAFKMLRSCAGWAQILYSCRTVPPSLQFGALARTDFETRGALDRLVGSSLSDEDWRLASLVISSG